MTYDTAIPILGIYGKKMKMKTVYLKDINNLMFLCMYVCSQGREGALKKCMANHSSILAWRTPWK